MCQAMSMQCTHAKRIIRRENGVQISQSLFLYDALWGGVSLQPSSFDCHVKKRRLCIHPSETFIGKTLVGPIVCVSNSQEKAFLFLATRLVPSERLLLFWDCGHAEQIQKKDGFACGNTLL